MNYYVLENEDLDLWRVKKALSQLGLPEPKVFRSVGEFAAFDLSTVLIAVGSAGAAIIAALWKVLWVQIKARDAQRDRQAEERSSEYKKSLDRLEGALGQCREDHKNQGARLIELTASVSRLEGYHDGVTNVTSAVIERLDSLAPRRVKR